MVRYIGEYITKLEVSKIPSPHDIEPAMPLRGDHSEPQVTTVRTQIYKGCNVLNRFTANELLPEHILSPPSTWTCLLKNELHLYLEII